MNSIKTAKNSNLIYDVGLHRGEDAEFYLRKGFSVIGFEADPELADYCRNRLVKYVENQKMVIVEGAIVDDEFLASGKTHIKFYKSRVSVCGTINPDWALRNDKVGTHSDQIEVKVVNFKELIMQYGIPYYMKIDIEGSDHLCLEALLDFDQKPDYVSIESEMVKFTALEEEISLLGKLGYNDFLAVQQLGVEKIRTPNPASEGNYVSYQFSDASTGLFGKELGGDWKSRAAILEQFRRIHRAHAIFSERGLQRNWIGMKIHGVLKRIIRRPLPGWYDTHARHGSAVS